jgi:hypothetical protein
VQPDAGFRHTGGVESPQRPDIPFPFLLVGGVLLVLGLLIVLQWIIGFAIWLFRVAVIVAIIVGLAIAFARLVGGDRSGRT